MVDVTKLVPLGPGDMQAAIGCTDGTSLTRRRSSLRGTKLVSLVARAPVPMGAQRRWLHSSMIHDPGRLGSMPDYFAGDDRTNRERMLAGDLYIADDPENLRIMHRAMVLSRRYADTLVEDVDAARAILSELLGSLGEDAFVRPPLHLDFGENLHLGDRVSVNFSLTALDVAEIRIGADTLIGPNVQLLTATHPLEPGPRRDKLESAKPITIGQNVWIGGGAIIGPGVTIGDDSVIGAGAVVVKDVPAGVVAVGNPARVVRELPE